MGFIPNCIAPAEAEWVALSDKGTLTAQGMTDASLDHGVFVMELSLPLQGSTVLLDHQQHGATGHSFSIFCDPTVGVVVLHRGAGEIFRHVLQGPLSCTEGTGRITFRFNVSTDCWDLTYAVLGREDKTTVFAKGRSVKAFNMADMHVTCTSFHRVRRHPSVLWFGLTRGDAPPALAAWVGMRTPVQTPYGLVAAGHLQPGDLVDTVDRGTLMLQAVRHMECPSRGSFAPVLLRAPYFGNSVDLLVAADQRVAIVGTEVEYLFGEEAVLMPAKAMVDNRIALADHRRATTSAVVLDFGQPALIEADGCVLAIPHQSHQPLLRGLAPFEVMTLQSLLGRSLGRGAG